MLRSRQAGDHRTTLCTRGSFRCRGELVGALAPGDTSLGTRLPHARFLLSHAYYLLFLFHLRALSANVARLRVFAFGLFFILRSFEAGILRPFLTPALRRSLPRLAFLILMGDRPRAMSPPRLRCLTPV